MRLFRAALLAAPFFFWASHVAAQDVTLVSRDGSIEISGRLLSFDGDYYRIDSTYGVLTLDGSAVVCEGTGCPDLSAFVADVSFSGARSMGAVLIPGAGRRLRHSKRVCPGQDRRGSRAVRLYPDRSRQRAVGRAVSLQP